MSLCATSEQQGLSGRNRSFEGMCLADPQDGESTLLQQAGLTPLSSLKGLLSY
jgi:hypothetical protein